MIRTHASIIILRPPTAVFEYVAVNFFRNYQRWCPEVVQLHANSPGPVRLGTCGRQVRIDLGLRSECSFYVSVFDPTRRIDFQCSSPSILSSYRLDQLGENTRLTFLFEYAGSNYLLLPFKDRIQQIVKGGTQQVVANIKALVESEAGYSMTTARLPLGDHNQIGS